MEDWEQIYMVEYGNIHVFTIAANRERAKHNAYSWIGGNADRYVVTPLTKPGDKVHLVFTL